MDMAAMDMDTAATVVARCTAAAMNKVARCTVVDMGDTPATMEVTDMVDMATAARCTVDMEARCTVDTHTPLPSTFLLYMFQHPFPLPLPHHAARCTEAKCTEAHVKGILNNNQ